MTRILIADDHEMVRRGLRELLESHPDWEVCGEALTGREAASLAVVLQPDVAVIDFTMPQLNGLEAARRIRAGSPSTEVLILTMHESEQLAREAVAAGARGFVLKSDAGRVLLAAVEALSQHRPFFSARLTERLGLEEAAPADQAPALPRDPLTPREREIVQLIAEGESTKAIADRLGISAKTADTHRTNLMRKLGLHTVSELVRYAIRNKLVEP